MSEISAFSQVGLTEPRQVSNPIVKATSLTKVYGRGDTAVTALDSIDVSIEAGKITAIMGPSGSGKSTLMHCLAGLDKATFGDIVVDGMKISQMSQRQLTRVRRDRIGFVFQSFNLIPTLTARENIVLPADIARRKIDEQRLASVVRAVNLEDRLDHRPAELSGGQQQRVAVARALAGDPAVVFADEPTGNLDSTSTLQVLQYLRAGADQFGQTIVLVTHEPEAAAWADRVLFLVDGKFVAQLENPTQEAILAALAVLSKTAKPEFETVTLPKTQSEKSKPVEDKPLNPVITPNEDGTSDTQQISDISKPAEELVGKKQPAAHRAKHEGEEKEVVPQNTSTWQPTSITLEDTGGYPVLPVERPRRRDLRKRAVSPKTPTSPTPVVKLMNLPKQTAQQTASDEISQKEN